MKNPMMFLALSLSANVLVCQLLPVDTAWVNQTMRSMTLEEKLGQLFFPAHQNLGKTLEMIRNEKVGGIWFSRTEARRIASEINELQKTSIVPLLVTADFEKGVGTYVDGGSDLLNNMALGASRNPGYAYELAAITAREGRAIGVHVNFAPVLDVNNNPANPIINTRSYGEDPALVAEMGAAAIWGYQDNGMIATAKHFPGHGDTHVDSHTDLGVIESSRETLERVELLPYREVMKKTELGAVMSAHLWIKAIDKDTVPATLSRAAMTDLLRTDMRFDGLVFTDAIEMGGIRTRYEYTDAVVKAIKAGCDVILFSKDHLESIEALKRAIESGEIPMEQIERSVRRILEAKTKVGAHKNRFVDMNNLSSALGQKEHYDRVKAIAKKCITLQRDTQGLLPLSKDQSVAVISITNNSRSAMTSRNTFNLPDELKKRGVNVNTIVLSHAPTMEDVASAVALARAADVTLISGFIRIVINSGTVELSDQQKQIVREIAAANPKTALISFGNPYIGGALPEILTYIAAYDNAQALQEAVAEMLFERDAFKGIIPVTLK